MKFQTINFKNKFGFMLILIYALHWTANAQDDRLSSLLEQLNTTTNDSVLIYTTKQLGYYYQHSNQDKAISYFEQGLNTAQKLKDSLQMANIYYSIGYTYGVKQEIPDALNNYLKAIRIYKDMKDYYRQVNTYMGIANLYMSDKDVENQIKYLNEAEAVIGKSKDSIQLSNVYSLRGVIYDQRKLYDSALVYLNKSLDVAKLTRDPNAIGSALTNLGLTYKHIGNAALALEYYDEAIDIYEKAKDTLVLSIIYNNIGSAHSQEGNIRKGEEALKTSIKYAEKVGTQQVILQGYKDLADLYAKEEDYKNQSEYLMSYYRLKDSLYTIQKDNQVAQLESEYTIEKKDLELEASQLKIEKEQKENTIYIIIICSGFLVLILLFFYFTRSKKKNELLQEQNSLISHQKQELQTAINNLKSTQDQLIQSEKMASLGELTAGIAHEIQNPLNFVNNFSEVSNELIDEMTEELKNGDIEEAKAIAIDVKQNLEKINHHGKRADSIVKGMLQHSRASGNKKEPTDINALADEYLRLAYHGLRAKDKTFNAELLTDFDESVQSIDVIPQDIGRVILNLVTNAFYAVHQKKQKAEDSYTPTVKITTNYSPLEGGMGDVTITVTDNGNGIPDQVKEKIFQPFFTTKPTGKGTGLGLSLSYEIIRKGHGGDITFKSKEGSGTTFTVELPIDQKD